MGRFILFSIFISLTSQEDAGCPNSTASWKKMETTYNCGRNKFYHCLRDERQRMIQMCLRRSWIEPGFCPVYSTFAHKIDALVCADSLGKCPTSTFWSNEPYKYPACLKAVDVENSKATDTSDLINNQPDREEKNTDRSGMVVGIIAGAIIVGTIIAIVAFIVFKKKRRRSQQKKNEAHTVNGIGKEPSKDEERTLLKTDLNESERSDTGGRRSQQKKNEAHSVNGIGKQTSKDEERTLLKTDFNESERSETEEKKVITRKRNSNKTLTPAETIDAIINENLTEEGSIVLLIGDNIEEKVKKTLMEKDKDLALIKSTDHCSALSEKSKGYVLITCFKTLGILSASLYKSDKINLIEDGIRSHGLRATILVGRDAFKAEGKTLFNFKLFNGLNPMFI